MSKRAAVAPYSGLLLLGDNVYPDGDPDRLDDTVFGPFAPVLTPGTKLLPVLGNHDVRAGHGPAQLARLGRASAWYTETLGPVQVIALDSTRPDDPAQRAWLAGVLKAPDPAWRVAIMHSPMYSAGMHGGVRSVRRAFEDVLVAGGVDLVLAGHDHDYQRSRPIRGMVHIVSGGAARLRRTGRQEFTAYSAATRHFLEIGAWSDRLRATAIDQDGRAFDDVFLRPSGE
jgi:3',5'-cyclic AMP phosphodiesterase CpdA